MRQRQCNYRAFLIPELRRRYSRRFRSMQLSRGGRKRVSADEKLELCVRVRMEGFFGAPLGTENSKCGPTIFVHSLLDRHLPTSTLTLGAIAPTKAPIVVWRDKNNAWAGEPMNRQPQFVGSARVVSMTDELRARKVSTVHRSMWDDPEDVIEAAIRSAFVSYPKDDDPDGRMYWIAPKECSQLAIAVILGLQAKGFKIVKLAT